VQSDLGNTLTLIADGGVDALYSGPVASALAGVSQTHGGTMTAQDLQEYAKSGAEIVAPIEASVGTLTLRSAPPPSSGAIVAAQVLGMLELLDLGKHANDSTEKYHLQIEASRLAYADRFAYIGDPRFVSVPQSALISPKYIAARAALISLSAANPNPSAGDPLSVGSAAPMYVPDAPVQGHTTHFTVADRFGNVVAFTSTIEQVFGSGHMVPGYGFMLNNELTDFSAVPGGPNQVEPKKAPVSSMTPMIVFQDGTPAFTLGAAGGLTIITSVLQTFNNLATYGMGVRDAVEEPRTFGALYPDVSWENGVPQAARANLSALGHSVDGGPSVLSNLQAMTIDASGFHGAADSSAPDGVAIGIDLVK
jgi:gamma-glutamyltranspeptidase/glutathione hydrolase